MDSVKSAVHRAENRVHDAADAARHELHDAAKAAKHTVHECTDAARRTIEKVEEEPAKSLIPLSIVIVLVAIITYWSIHTHSRSQTFEDRARATGHSLYRKVHDLEQHVEKAVHNAGQHIKRSAGDIVHDVEHTAYNVKHGVDHAAHNLMNKAENTAYNVKHGIDHTAHDVKQDLEDAAYDVKHGFQHAGHSVKNTAENAAYSVKHSVQHAGHSISEKLCTAEDYARNALCAVEDKFNRAVHWFQNALHSHSVPYADRLENYGLFQQATVGDAPAGSKPWAIQVEERAKWEAWNKFRGMSRSEAMAKYVLHTDSVDGSWFDSPVMRNYKKH